MKREDGGRRERKERKKGKWEGESKDSRKGRRGGRKKERVSIKGAYHFTHLFNSNWFTKLHWSIKILSNGTD